MLVLSLIVIGLFYNFLSSDEFSNLTKIVTSLSILLVGIFLYQKIKERGTHIAELEKIEKEEQKQRAKEFESKVTTEIINYFKDKEILFSEYSEKFMYSSRSTKNLGYCKRCYLNSENEIAINNYNSKIQILNVNEFIVAEDTSLDFLIDIVGVEMNWANIDIEDYDSNYVDEMFMPTVIYKANLKHVYPSFRSFMNSDKTDILYYIDYDHIKQEVINKLGPKMQAYF